MVFFDIDTQFDFMDPSGSLYVPGAGELVPKIRRLTYLAGKFGIPIISTMDWHKVKDPEFKLFPRHCVRNSLGSNKISQSLTGKTKQTILRKSALDVFSNPKAAQALEGFTSVFVYGVALDYCVRFACEGAVDLGLRVYLVKDAVKAVKKNEGKLALKYLSHKGVRFITVKTLEKGLNKCRIPI